MCASQIIRTLTGKKFSKITDILLQIHLKNVQLNIRRIHDILFMAFHFYGICEIVFVFYFEISLLIRNGKFCAKILFRQY